MVDRAARKIERERQKLDQQEKKHLKEIQKLAKQGQHVPQIHIESVIERGEDPFEGHCTDQKLSESILRDAELVKDAVNADDNDVFLPRNREELVRKLQSATDDE